MTTPMDDKDAAEAEQTHGRVRGTEGKRDLFAAGDRVQLTDPRGKLHTITLTPGGAFHTHRGYFRHEDLIGQPEGTVITSTSGIGYLAFRPLLSDYVLSMPRGAAVVYPKDAGQIVQMADVFPGAVVVEAGVGSGALSMSLLRAVGEHGTVHSIERRADFAEVAIGNVSTFFGRTPPGWHVHVGDFAEVVATFPAGTVDRVVLDMLAPWENVAAAAHILRPGGVFIAYVATTTQLSRVAEGLRDDGRFTEPRAWESLVRSWHLEGLAVRPDHRMVGHTGFLILSRRLADGVTAPPRRRRPAKGAYPAFDTEWLEEDLGERPVSEKKVRRARRDIGRMSAAAPAPKGTDDDADGGGAESMDCPADRQGG